MNICACSALPPVSAPRANGSPAILFVDPKTQTLVDVDFSK
jgi:hypothetical protein